MTHLEKSCKHMIGEDLELLNFKELQRLEKQVSLGARKIHSKKAKSLMLENANLFKKIEGGCRTCHLNIDIMEGFDNDLETDGATQQNLHQTNLNLTLS
ncbi:MADS-box transcription factor 14-like [Cryptomeria japonica]|uniref:MADS-box transcription factor 14-like n=1 Tax=Cryptomeria japonica TaxID=3369 RepID=UPI0027DA5389|nr:MADS-box transcription factor 14-like [Cryptomeria japonica]